MFNDKVVEFSYEKCIRFKKEYLFAQESKQEIFEFEGCEYVTEYARYLIKFLETRFGEIKW